MREHLPVFIIVVLLLIIWWRRRNRIYNILGTVLVSCDFLERRIIDLAKGVVKLPTEVVQTHDAEILCEICRVFVVINLVVFLTNHWSSNRGRVLI